MTNQTITPTTPVGTWTASSTIGGEAVPYRTRFEFRPDHTLTADGPPGPDGKPAFVGTGHWFTRPDGTFVHHVTHPVPDGSGGEFGTVHAIQQGTVGGDRFESSGSAVMHSADGVAEAVEVTLSADRA
ncbi:MAG: hypothetical protein ACRDVE_11855 [Actinocrinis sp.]